MFVLNRKKQQQIIINKDILLTVADIGSYTLRRGVDVPEDVLVHREEAHAAIRREEARTQSSGQSESTCSP